MEAMSSTPAPARPKLTRQRVLRCALDYADRNGLEALSMHKLGAELGVKAMSLYNHVANKDDVLAGIVDVLWSEVARPPADAESWQRLVRTLAGSIRSVILGHPHVAPLMMSGQALQENSLRVADVYRAALVDAGLPEECAVPFLRTVVSFAMGQSLAELTWSQATLAAAETDEYARIRLVRDLLPAGVSDDLVRTAMWSMP